MAGSLTRLRSSESSPCQDQQRQPGWLPPWPYSRAGCRLLLHSLALVCSALTYLGHTLIGRVACQRSRPFADLQCPFVLNVLFTLHSQQIWGRNSMNQNPFLTPPRPWSLRAKVPK